MSAGITVREKERERERGREGGGEGGKLAEMGLRIA